MPTQTLAAPTGLSALGAYGAKVSIRFDEITREISNAVTNWSQYFWKFFIRRKQDGEAFYVSFIDPATGAAETTKQFKFNEQQMDYVWFAYKLYSTGISLRQFIPLV